MAPKEPGVEPTQHKIEEDDGFIRETQIFGKFGTVRIDKIPETETGNADVRNPLSSTAHPRLEYGDLEYEYEQCSLSIMSICTLSIGISTEQSLPSRSATSGLECIGPFGIGPLQGES